MSLHVVLVSPEQVLYEGVSEMVVVRTIGEGEVAFQTDHARFLGALDTYPVRLWQSDGSQRKFAVSGGFVEVSNNTVTILSDVAELAEDIDVERARAARTRAEHELSQSADDPEARAALVRAETRLQVAGAS
ncbi:MAG: ATP synthase F1 subunit epsilon [Actinomycetota bacterium]